MKLIVAYCNFANPPKYALTKKLRPECTWGMPATIQSRILSSSLLCNNIKIETYRTVSLPVVLDETWCLTVKEEQKLRMFENRTLRKIYGSERKR